MSDFSLDSFIPYQLSVLAAQVSREFSAVYREKFDISVSEWRVVAHLSQTDDPVSVREIFQKVDMDKSRVSRAASRLESRGFVVKTPNKTDGRLVELTLSTAGRELIREMAPVAHDYQKRLLARLEGQDMAFRTALETLLVRK